MTGQLAILIDLSLNCLDLDLNYRYFVWLVLRTLHEKKI